MKRKKKLTPDVERRKIMLALVATVKPVYNVTKAAKLLKMPLSTLKYKMKRLGFGRRLGAKRGKSSRAR